MCLENISKDFAVNNIKKTKKTGLNGYVCDFSVDYNIKYKSMCVFILKMFIRLLSSAVNAF